MDKETIKSILLAHGFTIKQGEADLKPYVYSAASAIYEAGWMKGAEKGGRDVEALVAELEDIDQWVSRWVSADHPVAKAARKALAAYRTQGGE